MADVIVTYPPQSVGLVHVFELSEIFSNSADPIGKVPVVDGSFTAKCKYDQVLQSLKKKLIKRVVVNC
ncbi:hypothetical protein [Bacteroides sp.]|uniref:hypothetical protein n=1 Tax=Bacteroides sp. TaxID=29523 RepID=UPI003A93B6E6